MKTFEEFRKSRERTDPSASELNDHQWEQAYAAYLRTREKRSARGGAAGEGSSRSRSGRSGRSRRSGRGTGATTLLRKRIRGQSAYLDLRVGVNVLTWIALGVVVLGGIIRASLAAAGGGSVGTSLMLEAILLAVFQALAVVLARLLAFVLIDMADIALHRAHGGSEPGKRESPDSESDSAKPVDDES